jgi:glutamate synthase (ferredoxin)
MWILIVFLVFLAIVAGYDLVQKHHTILRNFPIIGHFRYMLEAVGPELRQYIVTSNDEERPFSRDQRSWIYASAKGENNTSGFGTDNLLENSPNYLIVKQDAVALPGPPDPEDAKDGEQKVPCGRVLGEWRDRPEAFRPDSAIYVSGMSFGSLSGPAVEALNRGCAIDGSLQNTGEGGLSKYHKHGGELIFQIGTAYFGCRDENGHFDMDVLLDTIDTAPVRAIEIKLSQGAKPGQGGVLPAPKVTSEIAAARGVPEGVTCVSPPAHREFHDVDGLIDFAERLASATGKPIGIKTAVGNDSFFYELAERMKERQEGPDYVVVDGGEGGTGAAPFTFADHVAFPFRTAFSRVYRAFASHDMHKRVLFVGSGRLGLPERALFAFGLGCDMVAVGREAMLSIGCIQAQRCHTGHCPSGVATQNRWLMRGLDPTSKSARLANYMKTLRKELLWLSRAVGVPHPALVTVDDFDFVNEIYQAVPPRELFKYEGHDWTSISDREIEALTSLLPAFDVEPWKARVAAQRARSQSVQQRAQHHH